MATSSTGFFAHDKSTICPICRKIASSHGTQGWHSHVGPRANHPEWHPDLHDAPARCDVFRAEHPEYFAGALTPSRRSSRPPIKAHAPTLPRDARVACLACNGEGHTTALVQHALRRLLPGG